MAKIKLSTTAAQPSPYGTGFQVIYSFNGKPDPFPPRVLDVRTTAEALAAMEAYKAEAAATGAQCVATMRIIQGRAPNGFNKATQGNSFYQPINL